MIDSELRQHCLEAIVDGHSEWALNHVGSQVDPLIMVFFDDIFDDRLSISVSTEDVTGEFAPVDRIVMRCAREAIVLVVGKAVQLAISLG